MGWSYPLVLFQESILISKIIKKHRGAQIDKAGGERERGGGKRAIKLARYGQPRLVQ